MSAFPQSVEAVDDAPARAAALLVHPLVLGACVLLAFNDHVLKHVHPGVLSGKLSDVAFMVLAPIWLYVGGLWLAPRLRHHAGFRRALLYACLLGVGGLFAAMQLTDAGDALYRHGLGLLQWPARAAFGWLTHGQWLAPQPVAATPDASDLLCLPWLYLAYRLAHDSASAPGARRLVEARA